MFSNFINNIINNKSVFSKYTFIIFYNISFSLNETACCNAFIIPFLPYF